MEIDRNTIYGFGWRVRTNLAFMIAARERGEDVHIITELTNSLLGLIVFPYEHLRRKGFYDFRKHRLNDMEAAGWSSWVFDVGFSADLNDLVRHLRNSLSHRRVCFSSDDRSLEKVEITFWDQPTPDAAENWRARINAAALMDFALRLSKLIDDKS